MTNHKLPPRKWYTLEQAVKQINRLTKENIDIDDLLHFAFINKLELCVYVKYKEDDRFIIDGEIKREYIENNGNQLSNDINLVFSQNTIREILNRNPKAKEYYKNYLFSEIEDEFYYLQIAINRHNEKFIDLTIQEISSQQLYLIIWKKRAIFLNMKA